MLFHTPLLMALPFLLLVLIVGFYLKQSAAPLGEHSLDKQFAYEIKAIQQAITGMKSRIQKSLQSISIKERLVKLRPSDATMGCTGCYIILTTILDYISGELTIYWYIVQFFIGIWLIGYGIVPKKTVPSWEISLFWLVCTVFCLPVNVFWHWFHVQDPQFALTLSVGHLSATLFVLPLYISIKLVVSTLLVIFYAIYNIGVDQLLVLGNSLLSLLGFGLMAFSIIIYNKRKIAAHTLYNRHLKSQVKLAENKDHAPIQTNFNLHSENTRKNPKEAGSCVEKAMQGVTEFMSYLDNRPLYQQDIQSIINNFVTFTTFLKQQARSTDHISLMPNEITIDELISKLETTLEAKASPAPKLVVEIKDNPIPKKIICDINHMIQSLVPIVLRTAGLGNSKGESVRIQLHTTHLKYAQKGKPEMNFPAIALVISSTTIPLTILPQIKNYYEDIIEGRGLKWHSSQTNLEHIQVEKRVIERAVCAHYGYLRFPISKKRPMLMVLPCNVVQVRDAMIDKILPLNVPVTQKEIDQSMEVFVRSYNHLLEICQARKAVLDEILLLTRRCYGFRRHLSGQLLYIRAIGIAQLVAEWIRFYPEPIYVVLLCDLVHYADLPLAYIKANYDLNICSFIESILAANDRQSMEPCGLYIGNSFKQIINREQLFVLCIKLAERLYDLRHAKSYTHLDALKYMAEETLKIDIELAKKYLNTKIVEELANAAEQALQICEKK